MLLNDRFVGSFGIVAPGDRELIVKVAVAAVRNGFAVVPMQDDTVMPACALTIAAAKKPHDCYHVLTEDTKVRPAFQRLTKDDKTCNLAVDIGASNIGVTSDVSWWEGPTISPTLIGLGGDELYVFDLNGYEGMVPDQLQTEGTLLVPPSTDGEKSIQLVGQMNHLNDNVPTDNKEESPEEMASPAELWNPAKEEELNLRVSTLEGTVDDLRENILGMGQALDDLREQNGKLQNALVVALTTLKELRDRKE